MEVDSYVKHKMLNIEYIPELTEKPNDFYRSYLFARDNRLKSQNFLKSHLLIATHLLPKHQQGIVRLPFHYSTIDYYYILKDKLGVKRMPNCLISLFVSFHL